LNIGEISIFNWQIIEISKNKGFEAFLMIFENLYFLKNISFSENCLQENLGFLVNYWTVLKTLP
jgi:hypothetical protein